MPISLQQLPNEFRKEADTLFSQTCHGALTVDDAADLIAGSTFARVKLWWQGKGLRHDLTKLRFNATQIDQFVHKLEQLRDLSPEKQQAVKRVQALCRQLIRHDLRQEWQQLKILKVGTSHYGFRPLTLRRWVKLKQNGFSFGGQIVNFLLGFGWTTACDTKRLVPPLFFNDKLGHFQGRLRVLDPALAVKYEEKASSLVKAIQSIPQVELKPVKKPDIFTAIDSGEVEKLAECKKELNAFWNGCPPLLYAYRHGKTACVDKLRSLGANLNGKDVNGCTLLHEAAFRGDLNEIKVLLKKKVALNDGTLLGETPLFKAIAAGHIDCAELLLKQSGIIPSLEPQMCKSPLAKAVERGNLSLVKQILQKQGGVTPEHYALLDFNPTLRGGVVPAGVNAVVGHDGIMRAVLDPAIHAEVVRHLTHAPAKKDGVPFLCQLILDRVDHRVLVAAIRNSHLPLNELFEKKSLLNWALLEGSDPKVIDALLTPRSSLWANFDLNARDDGGKPAAHRRFEAPVLAVFLKHGVSLTQKDAAGTTLLERIIAEDQPEALLEHPTFDINQPLPNGYRLLDLLMSRCHMNPPISYQAPEWLREDIDRQKVETLCIDYLKRCQACRGTDVTQDPEAIAAGKGLKAFWSDLDVDFKIAIAIIAAIREERLYSQSKQRLEDFLNGKTDPDREKLLEICREKRKKLPDETFAFMQREFRGAPLYPLLYEKEVEADVKFQQQLRTAEQNVEDQWQQKEKAVELIYRCLEKGANPSLKPKHQGALSSLQHFQQAKSEWPTPIQRQMDAIELALTQKAALYR